MARFFLNIRLGAALIEDQEGGELPNLAKARAEAVAAARELVAMDLRANRPASDYQIEICDEVGRLLDVVSAQTVLCA